MKRKDIEFDVSRVASGALQEKIDGEMNKVFANIHDMNTEAGAKRTLTVKIELKPNDNRETVDVKADVTVKLAPVEGVTTTMLTGKSLATGKIEARELKSGTPGQTYIDDNGEQRTDTGEPIDVIEKEMSNKIIDLQQKKRG
ncbi:phage protein [Ligilactobacillus salitolerans]|uniref:Phage protein n=1 Tax=Ligilactobacillus salitolerans TaxID=1808352 RepID=A0A401ITR9_9LACO|nr:replication terminator protein [Ligilactobacillus salitolerans]GBG94953.1 phage protein [Ligilactobacillus salitolerans]